MSRPQKLAREIDLIHIKLHSIYVASKRKVPHNLYLIIGALPSLAAHVEEGNAPAANRMLDCMPRVLDTLCAEHAENIASLKRVLEEIDKNGIL